MLWRNRHEDIVIETRVEVTSESVNSGFSLHLGSASCKQEQGQEQDFFPWAQNSYRNTGQEKIFPLFSTGIQDRVFFYRNRACKQGFFTGQGFTIKDKKLPKLLMPYKKAVVSLMVLLFSILIPVFLYNFYRKTGFLLFEPWFSLFNPCIPVKFWQADRISYSRYKTLYRVLYFLFSGISIFQISVQGYRTGP